jgi:acetamidase/formamidase
VLEVRIDDVVPATWGTTYAGLRSTAWNARLGLPEPAVHSWAIEVDTGSARNQLGHTVAVRPFLGVIGMPPAALGRHSTIPPRWHGGNLDCRELVAGSTLYLPIPVDGALLSVGDAHAAQGEGEVSGTAIECGTERADLTLDVRDDLFGRPGCASGSVTISTKPRRRRWTRCSTCSARCTWCRGRTRWPWPASSSTCG